MVLMVVPGVVSLVFGGMFLCAPQRLMTGRPHPERSWIETDAFLLKYRYSTGIASLGLGSSASLPRTTCGS